MIVSKWKNFGADRFVKTLKAQDSAEKTKPANEAGLFFVLVCDGRAYYRITVLLP
jgi:hypothetical protein